MERTAYKSGELVTEKAEPARRPLVKAYCTVLLWFLGRAVAAGSAVDPEVRAEAGRFPEGFSFALLVLPAGPGMALREKNGRLVVDKKRAKALTRGRAGTSSPVLSSKTRVSSCTSSSPLSSLASSRQRRAVAKPEMVTDLVIKIKSLEAAWRLFTFRESTCVSQARDRMAADGNIGATCGVVRILDRIEIYLLPAFFARRAVKRYRRPEKFWLRRLAVYGRTVLGL